MCPVKSGRYTINKDKHTPFILNTKGFCPNYNPFKDCLWTSNRHIEFIESVCIIANGRQAISRGHDNTLKVWDLDNGTCLKNLKAISGTFRGFGITPDGRNAIVSTEKGLKLWNLETGSLIKTLAGYSHSCISPTADGKRVLAANNATLTLWDIEIGKCVKTMNGHSEAILCVNLTPDSRLAISGSSDNTLRLWNLETGHWVKILEGHSDWVTAVYMTPDGRQAISGSQDRTLKLWDLETGDCIKTLEGHTQNITCIGVTPDGKQAISGSESSSGNEDINLKLWDLQKGTCIKNLIGHTNSIKSVSITSDGRRAISASLYTLKYWNLESGKFVKKDKHAKSINNICLANDDCCLISEGDDRIIKIWDTENGESIKTLRGSIARLTPDSLHFCYSQDHFYHIEVRELKTLKILRILRGRSAHVYDSCITPDNKRIVTACGDNTLKIWDWKKGKCIKTLEGHQNGVESIRMTSDGVRVISVSNDKIIKLWDLVSGTCIKSFPEHEEPISDICLTPDEKYLLSGSRCILKLWNLETGNCEITLATKHASGYLRNICLTPDGRHVFFGDDNNTVWECDLVNRRIDKEIIGHTYGINSFNGIRLTLDGNHMISGGNDGSLKILDVKSGHCLAIYYTGNSITTISRIMVDGKFTVGTSAGEIINVFPINLQITSSVPIITAHRHWSWGTEIADGAWSPDITAHCEWCGTNFPFSTTNLDTISAINLSCNITPDDSPCLKLPDEAWDEPKLIFDCPKCGGKLKSNPFVVDNRGRWD